MGRLKTTACLHQILLQTGEKSYGNFQNVNIISTGEQTMQKCKILCDFVSSKQLNTLLKLLNAWDIQ
jgi:hypothetical protein